MYESLLAGALALAQPQLAEAPYTHPHIKQVRCTQSLGTAFRLSRGRFATVHHVSDNSNCTIMGRPMAVEYQDAAHDFAIVTIPDDPETGGIEVSCSGFISGMWYYSMGFARGLSPSVVISIRNGGPITLVSIFKGWSIFEGIEYVIPGMSGGPVVDSQGRAVGTVNAYNDAWGLSWSRPLSETILCD